MPEPSFRKRLSGGSGRLNGVRPRIVRAAAGVVGSNDAELPLLMGGPAMRILLPYKVIFRKPNGATRVVRVVAESPGAARQKAGLPQNEESVEITEEQYERAAFVRQSSRRGSNTRIAPDTVDPR